MNAVAPHTVSSSSSKKCSSRSVGLRPQRSEWYVSGRTSSPSGSHITRSTSGLAGASGTTAGQAADDGHDVAAADDRAEVVELGEQRHERRVEPDLLVGLAQGRLGRRLAGVRAAAREADLALVVAHVARAPGQQHLGALLAVGEGDEHGRRPGVGERRGDRAAGRRRR